MQTEQIREWFDSVPAPHQADIAIFTMTMIEDGNTDLMSAETDKAIDRLRAWLTPQDEFEYRTLGKALSFVAVFENMFESRFTAEGWVRPRKMFERVLEEQPDGGMVKTAQENLALLPQKQEDWKKIGESWNEAKAQISFEVPIRRIGPEPTHVTGRPKE